MRKSLFGFLLLLISGCSTVTDQIGVIAPAGTGFNYSDIANASIHRQAHGQDSSNILLFIPLGFPNFDTAVKNTLRNGSGNVLINAQIVSETRWYILFGTKTINITGDVVNLQNNGGYSHE